MALSKKELQEKIRDLEETLADVEEEREFMLSKTLIHVPGVAREKYAKEIAQIKEQINLLKKQLEDS
ncbi:hypothetical protein [Desulfolucanica intricata]|uniref:hypothetical protein n=1 Tax=Desulfolucanica intricata TaxID=1285191 RepID=UPI00083648FB|nr:hypothetical protein [Desulfolucanica intricata]